LWTGFSGSRENLVKALGGVIGDAGAAFVGE
jgi:hypothetical protein